MKRALRQEKSRTVRHRPMRQEVDIHIDELVLHGFAHRDRFRIAQAIESELSRLISEEGIPPTFTTRKADRPVLDAGPIDIESGTRPDVVGSRVARAVYGRMK